MSFKDFIQNESSKDKNLENKIKEIVSDEIDYKNIKFDYSDNEMKVYITPEDEDENCLILGKKLEKLFKNKIPGFMVYNDTKNKGSFTIDLSVEHINENTINDVPAPFQGILKRFDGYLKFQFGKIEFVNCQVEKSNIFIKYKSSKSNKGHKLTFKVTDSLDRMFGYMFVIRPVSGKLDSEDIIISVAPKKLFLDKFDGNFEKTMSYCSNELTKNLKESDEKTLSEEVQQIISERPSLIVKAGRLKKLRKFHKTSQFKNVIHKKNLRALKTAAGIKKKKAKKRYMKKYTRKYGKIMALRAKKYQNIVKESFNKINMYNNVKVKGLAFTYDISSCTFDDQDSAIIVVKKDNRDLAEKTESISKSFMEWLSDRYPYYIFSREIKRDQKDGYIAVIKHKPNFKVLFKIFEQCVSENKTVEDFLKTYCKKVLVWD